METNKINSFVTRQDLKPVKNLFLDVDEILIQSEHVRMGIRNNYLVEKLNLPEIEFDEYSKNCVGKDLHHIISWLSNKNKNGHSFDPDKAYNEIFEQEANMYRKGAMKTMPYAKEFLEEMQKKKVRMAVCSGANKRILRKKLESAGISDFFPDDSLFSREEAENRSKPSPMIYLAARRAFGAEYCDSRVIEDSQEGVISGDMAFLPVIAMPTKWSKLQDFNRALMLATNGFLDILEYPQYYLGFPL